MISTHVAWTEGMSDPATDEFKTVKKMIEKKLDDTYTANDYMITDGYAGSTVVAIGLVQLEDLDPSQVPSARKKRETNGTSSSGNNTTNGTSTAATPAAGLVSKKEEKIGILVPYILPSF